LIKAAEAGHENIVKFLLDRGSPVLMANNEGMTALDFAKANGHMHIARVLEKKMQSDREEGQQFLDAVFRGDEDLACTLIYGGVNLDVGYSDGKHTHQIKLNLMQSNCRLY
jgi:ankyrin repeat protein